MKRAALHTLGCRLNQSETNLIREQLEARGYEVVPFDAEAELGIVNTCTVTREADAKSRKSIRSFIRRNPQAFVAVIGCYSQTGTEALTKIEGIDLIVGNQEKLSVLDYVSDSKNETPLVIRDQFVRDDFTIDFAGETKFERRANLKIQDGCDFMCSFCVIPFARGRARSRELENLLGEARRLVDRGAKEIVLTGVNIGTYGFEGHGVVEVVDRLNEIQGLARIRISSIEPTTIPQGLFERMADSEHALVPYLHIPLQSGSNRVLETMRRQYTREKFVEFIELADRGVPGLCIGTDVLVGSPGEREEDFKETCALLVESPIAYVHVFKYSEREGTAAVRIPEKVTPEEKTRRSAVVRGISARKLAEFQGRRLGKTVEVLFEQGEDGLWTGYTGDYIRVSVCSNAILRNEMREVVLDEIRGDVVHGRLAQPAMTEVIG